jgi:tetratricopeptide (TPR) repeat protein
MLLGLALVTSFTLQGQITTDKAKPEIRLILEDPKGKPTEIARSQPDRDGKYSFPGLTARNYRVVATIDGKKQDRRDVEIVCRDGAIVSKDFHYGKTPQTLNLGFPAEDPDTVEVAELAGNYPKDVLRDYEKAFEDHLGGNIVRAVQRLEAIVERAPGFYGAHARLGLIFQGAGCFADAEAEYVRASAISPRSVQPLINLASAQIRSADIPEQFEPSLSRALETLNKALILRPGSAIAHCLIGAAKVRLANYADAEKSFLRALDLDSDLSAAQLMLANLYMRQEKWDDALEHLKQYLEDNPFARDRSVVKEMIAGAEKKRRQP